MKSEPDVFSIQDLARQKHSLWDGVRNYQARNFMTQSMQLGDRILFYHSNAEPPGVAGVAQVASLAQVDPTQFDKKSEYFDPKATPTKPIWFGVRVEYIETLPRLISLEEMRGEKALQDMLVLKRGQRLSIQPVTVKEFNHILKLAQS